MSLPCHPFFAGFYLLTYERRLKLNFTNLSDDDNARLLKCHREVEEAFEKERWSLVSRSMSREGSENYVVSIWLFYLSNLQMLTLIFPSA